MTERLAVWSSRRRVESTKDAERMRFLSSPTVRVDGVDVDVTASTRDDVGLKCGLYRRGDGSAPVPPDDWIRRALTRNDQPGASGVTRPSPGPGSSPA